MKNGQHPPSKNDELARLLRANNALLVEQISQTLSLVATLEVLQAYLPFAAASDQMPQSERQLGLAKAVVASEKRLRKSVNARISRILRDAS